MLEKKITSSLDDVTSCRASLVNDSFANSKRRSSILGPPPAAWDLVHAIATAAEINPTALVKYLVLKAKRNSVNKPFGINFNFAY